VKAIDWCINSRLGRVERKKMLLFEKL